MPAMSVEDAYKMLKATAGSTWESIEQTRRQLVQQSHPVRLKSMSAELRSRVLAEAKRANAAYLTLSRARCSAR
jgi:DnaJ-domain-containing protein 1